MRGTSHAILGLSAAAVVFTAARSAPDWGLPMALGTVIGSLLPDADSPGSFYLEHLARQWARRRSIALRMTGLVILLLILPFRYAVMGLGLPHRGPLHTPHFAALWMGTGLALGFAVPLLGALLIGLGIGVLVHLAADSTTPGGINWFGRRIRGPIRTGSAMEIGLVSLVVMLSALVVFLFLRGG